jgi:DNA-binding SARP family transcriptional activator
VGRLVLLGGFDLWLDDQQVSLTLSSQRLLAFVALPENPLSRASVATALWGEYVGGRPIANLRTALARLSRGVGRPVEASGRQLKLAEWVAVDVRETSKLIRRVLDGDERILRLPGIHRRLVPDLLPGWYEDWVLAEQERYRQLRLRALEALCDAYTAAREFAPATEAALAAVAAEPLRDSAQRALIRAYLAEGNRAAATRQYRQFCYLLDRELGLAPSPSLTALVAGTTGS